MEQADRDRSAQPSPASAGTLDIQNQAAGPPGDVVDQPAGGPGQAGSEQGVAAGEHGPAAGRRLARLRAKLVPSWLRLPSWLLPSWLRRAARSAPARQGTLLLLFLAAGVVATIPRVTYLTGHLLPASRDSASYVWGFWWMARQVTHLANPWFTSHMAAPVGVQIGFHTLMPLPGLLLTPVTLAFGPSASYTVMVLAVPGLLCYAMYRAARLWLSSATGAVAAGAFFGLSCMLTQQAWYHVNISAGAIFLPIALEASVRLRRRPGVRQAVILGLVMGAAVLTDQESAVLAAIVTGLTLVPWLVRQVGRARLVPAALAVLAGAVIASPQIVAMIQEIRVGQLSIPLHTLAVSYKQYGIGLPGMFSPTPRVSDFGLAQLAAPFNHGRDNEGMPMFGSVLTLLALLGLAAAWRRRSAWLLGALWAGCAALALGTSLWIGKHQYLPLASDWHGVRVSNLMPYTWFVRIPGLSSFREADRLAILGLLPAALLAGAAVDWLRVRARRGQPRRYVAWALLVVVAAGGILEAGYSGNPRVGRIPTSYPALDAQIAADPSPDSIVLDLPFGMRGGIPVYGTPFFPQALVMATADGHPRSIAYTSRVPVPTITAMNNHPFYRDLVTVQHETPRVCPWALPPVPGASGSGCTHPLGVIPVAAIKVSPAQLAAAAQDADRMHIKWVVVWKRNISVQDFILPYLNRTGFRFHYRVGNLLVYRHHRVG